MIQVIFHFIYIRLNISNFIGSFLNVKLGDFPYWFLAEMQHILTGDFFNKELTIRIESLLDSTYLVIPAGSILLQLLIQALLEENLLQRNLMPLVTQFFQSDFQLTAKQIHGIVGVDTQDFLHRHQAGLTVENHAGIGRIRHAAIRKSIQSVYRLVGRNTRIQMQQNFGLTGGIIINLLDFQLPFLDLRSDRLNQVGSVGTVWYLSDYQCFLIQNRYFGTIQNLAIHPFVVLVHIDITTCREVGINLKILAFQYSHRSIQELIEIVRQYLGSDTHADTLCALG